MTNEEKDLKIAELRGIVPCRTWRHGYWGNFMKLDRCEHDKCYPIDCPVQYTKYLDAMHQAEMDLTEEEWEAYCSYLVGHCFVYNRYSPKYKDVAHATAERKADAFIYAKSLEAHDDIPYEPTPDFESDIDPAKTKEDGDNAFWDFIKKERDKFLDLAKDFQQHAKEFLTQWEWIIPAQNGEYCKISLEKFRKYPNLIFPVNTRIWSGEHTAYLKPNGRGLTTDPKYAGIWDLSTVYEAGIKDYGPEKKIEFRLVLDNVKEL